MLNVGVTGNIASGKSTVVELFKKWGATVIDADSLAREAQAPGSAVLAAIARRFGTDVLSQDGTLDRAALRAHVIDNAGTLAELEKQAQRVFADLRKRAAHAGVQNEAPGQTLLLCALDARD